MRAGEPARFPESRAEWIAHAGGLVDIGHDAAAPGAGFAFDNEGPRHRVWLEPFEVASRLVTCGDFLRFIEAGGYREPRWWLSDGWATVQAQGWRAPASASTRRPPTPNGPARACPPSRNGGRGRPARHGAARRSGLAMDPLGLSPVSGLPSAGGRRLGIQRQVHGRPAGAARRQSRDADRTHPPELPQLLPAGRALAIQRAATGPRCASAHGDSGMSSFADDLHAALAGPVHEISPKYFYDAEGSALFERICELPE
ncbi:sulfatase-modifying factor enzyme 1 domain-containing protein [Ditylenchus destructor]|nr:sulfatase-modifying factor enzyme 1 domain-containing protein [Ditylenchus destructor]